MKKAIVLSAALLAMCSVWAQASDNSQNNPDGLIFRN